MPLVSYLLLGGRCRHCRARIPWRYPLVEASTAALFVGCLEFFGATSDAVVAAVLGCLLIALAWIDAEHFILPDLLTLPGLMAGLVVGPLTGWISWRGALVGAAVGGGMLWLLREAWIILRKEEGMGLGDVKMLAMVGAFLGWKGVVVTLFLSSLAGATVGLGLMALGRVGMKSELPFGVFLGAGALAALFTGPYLVARYLSLL